MPWYRTIKPEDEIKALTIRERLSSEELKNQRARCPQGYNSATALEGKRPDNFTHLSAFHYITAGVRQRLFTEYKSEENIGIRLLSYSSPSRSVFWRDSNRTDVSDDIFKQYHTSQDFQKALGSNGFVEVTDNIVSQHVRDRFSAMEKQYIKEKLDPKDAQIAWTEGLFRYKWKEIDGIVINPNNLKSCLKGAAFAQVVKDNTGKECKIYSCNATGSELTEVSRDVLAGKLASSQMQLRELYKQYTKCQQRLEGQKQVA